MELPKNKFISGEVLGFTQFTPEQLKRYSQMLAKLHAEGVPPEVANKTLEKEYIKNRQPS